MADYGGKIFNRDVRIGGGGSKGALYVNDKKVIDEDGNIVAALDLSDLEDVNGNEMLEFDAVASAVNYFRFANSATGNAVVLSAQGDDTNVSITITAKGTGTALLTGAAAASGNTAGGVASVTGGAGFGTGAGGAVTITGGASGAGATGNGGTVTIAGGAAASTNGNGGDLILNGGALAGTGVNGNVVVRKTLLLQQGAAAAKTTAVTLTAAEIIGGILTANQGGAAAADYTLPLATSVDTALPNSAANDAFDFSIINISTNAAEDITVVTNTGWTLVGEMTVESNDADRAASTGRFRARKTGTGAWTLYRIA